MPGTEERRPLAEHRRRRFLTIRALADLASVNTGTIVDIEHGRTVPRFETIRKIAGALGVEALAVTEFAQVIEEPETGKAAARDDLAAA